MYNDFYIQVPIYNYWEKYGWAKNEWGIGLEKERVDALALKNKTLIIRVGNDPNGYKIKATKVQTFPIERIKNWDKYVYIVKRSAMRYKPVKSNSVEDLAKLGVYG